MIGIGRVAKRRRKSGIVIPWERHGRVLDVIRAARVHKVLALALALAALVWVFRHDAERSRLRETRAAIAELGRAVSLFRADHGRCPRGLRELTRPPSGGAPYVREVPRDGWGHAFALVCPGRMTPDIADVRSRGPDGTWFGMDGID